MAAPAAYRVDNFAAALQATKDILPYLGLFYAIDVFIWYNGGGDTYASAQLASNIMISTFFIAGFWAINFFRGRSRLKAAAEQQGRTMVVQQPVYTPAPPGYAYPQYPGYYPYPPQGAPGAPPLQPPAPPPAPWPEKKQPPEGSA